jgi:hypothetical protein
MPGVDAIGDDSLAELGQVSGTRLRDIVNAP